MLSLVFAFLSFPFGVLGGIWNSTERFLVIVFSSTYCFKDGTPFAEFTIYTTGKPVTSSDRKLSG